MTTHPLPLPRRRGRSFAHTLAVAAVCACVAGCAGLPPAPAQDPPAPAQDPPAELFPAAAAREAPAAVPAALAEIAPPAAPAAVVPDDTVHFRARLDPADDAARLDLWQRLRRGYALPDIDNDLVRKWEQWYAARPDYVERMTGRGGRYLFHVLEEIDKRGMPTDLALLPFIESAFNPQSLSGARAAGLWQFMPATGRDFDLTQNVFRDDRRAVLASTRAALDYLQRLHELFAGDWQLALAAYNWGQGNVSRALGRAQAAGQPGTYDAIRMPDETRNYLPKLQAVKNIVAQPEAYGLALPPLDNHPYFLTVAIERDIDVDIAARLSGLSLDDFHALNPQMNKPVILAAGTPHVLLPYDNANRFVREVQGYQGQLASWTAWVVPKTVKPGVAARQAGVSEKLLRDVNHIPPKMLVKAGSTLLVPRRATITADVAEFIADGGALSLAPDKPARRKASAKAGRKGKATQAITARAPAQGSAKKAPTRVARAPAKRAPKPARLAAANGGYSAR